LDEETGGDYLREDGIIFSRYLKGEDRDLRVSGMRYYFDVDDQIDDTGTDLPSKAVIPREAIGLVLAVASNAPETVRTVHIAVRDQDRRPVYRASLKLDCLWTEDAPQPQSAAALSEQS